MALQEAKSSDWNFLIFNNKNTQAKSGGKKD